MPDRSTASRSTSILPSVRGPSSRVKRGLTQEQVKKLSGEILPIVFESSFGPADDFVAVTREEKNVKQHHFEKVLKKGVKIKVPYVQKISSKLPMKSLNPYFATVSTRKRPFKLPLHYIRYATTEDSGICHAKKRVALTQADFDFLKALRSDLLTALPLKQGSDAFTNAHGIALGSQILSSEKPMRRKSGAAVSSQKRSFELDKTKTAVYNAFPKHPSENMTTFCVPSAAGLKSIDHTLQESIDGVFTTLGLNAEVKYEKKAEINTTLASFQQTKGPSQIGHLHTDDKLEALRKAPIKSVAIGPEFKPFESKTALETVSRMVQKRTATSVRIKSESLSMSPRPLAKKSSSPRSKLFSKADSQPILRNLSRQRTGVRFYNPTRDAGYPTLTPDKLSRLMYIFEYEMFQRARYRKDPTLYFPLYDATEMIHDKFGGLFDSWEVERVYWHWVARRRGNGRREKPLAREFEEAPDSNEDDTHVAFRLRPRGERQVTTRRQTQRKKKNDLSAYRQLQAVAKHLDYVSSLLRLLKLSQLIKRRMLISEFKHFEDSIVANTWFSKEVLRRVNTKPEPTQMEVAAFKQLQSPLFDENVKGFEEVKRQIRCEKGFLIASRDLKEYSDLLQLWTLGMDVFKRGWQQMASNMASVTPKVMATMKAFEVIRSVVPLKDSAEVMGQLKENSLLSVLSSLNSVSASMLANGSAEPSQLQLKQCTVLRDVWLQRTMQKVAKVSTEFEFHELFRAKDMATAHNQQWHFDSDKLCSAEATAKLPVVLQTKEEQLLKLKLRLDQSLWSESFEDAMSAGDFKPLYTYVDANDRVEVALNASEFRLPTVKKRKKVVRRKVENGGLVSSAKGVVETDNGEIGKEAEVAEGSVAKKGLRGLDVSCPVIVPWLDIDGRLSAKVYVAKSKDSRQIVEEPTPYMPFATSAMFEDIVSENRKRALLKKERSGVVVKRESLKPLVETRIQRPPKRRKTDMDSTGVKSAGEPLGMSPTKRSMVKTITLH